MKLTKINPQFFADGGEGVAVSAATAENMQTDATTSVAQNRKLLNHINERTEPLSTAKTQQEVKSIQKFDPNSNINYVAIRHSDIVGNNIQETDTFAKKARLYLNQHFKKSVLPLAKTRAAYIRKAGINEVTNPAKYLPYEDYRGKMLAVTELDSLLKASTYLRWEKDDGRHPDAKRWLFYQTIFLFTDENGQHQVIRGVVNIKRIWRGDCFHDITKIKNITNSHIGQSIINHYTAESVSNASNKIISNPG